jgi:flagellar hook-length control protein FliK
LQAALLVAANLNAGALNIAGTANVQAQAGGSAGLKFGAILPNPTPGQAKADLDTTAGNTPGTDGSDPSADAPDPSKTIPAMPAPKPQANSTAGTSAKTKSTAAASSPVAAAYAGQSGATTTQPVAPSIVQPWAAASVVAGSSEDTLASPAVSGDAELSGWPPYLDADAAGTAAPGVSARTAAFLAQLKQNVQVPPAHEQVAIQIQKAMQNGSNRLTVNLEPAELGRVEVKLDVDKDKNVTASIVVDRPATLDLLQRDAKTLERALQDAGLQTNDGSLSFSLRNGAGQGSGGGNGANGQAGAGIRGGNAGAQASDATNQPARASVIATADGYVDLET